jgi:hypothetical protein
MRRTVTRATAVPRPAKLARQTRDARQGGRFVVAGGPGTAESYALGACRVGRAGFAGRDMEVGRATERSTLASGSDPRRSLGSVSYPAARPGRSTASRATGSSKPFRSRLPAGSNRSPDAPASADTSAVTSTSLGTASSASREARLTTGP